MNADTFYKNFKDVLDFLGASWDDKELVSVILDGNKLLFEYCGKEASFTIKNPPCRKADGVCTDACSKEQFEMECI